MLRPSAKKDVAEGCMVTAGIKAGALCILTEKFTKEFSRPPTTMAAVGGVLGMRPSTHPLVRLLSPGEEGVDAQEELRPAVGSSGHELNSHKEPLPSPKSPMKVHALQAWLATQAAQHSPMVDGKDEVPICRKHPGHR